MANYSKELEDRNFSRQAREARAERRVNRQRLIYDRLHEAFDSDVDTTNLRFADLHKEAFNYDSTPRDSTPIPSGMHPGDVAVSLVHETIAQYRVPAEVRLRYAGMDRKAGRGGHNISEGTIFVGGEVKPIAGISSYITVPIVVRGSRLLSPSMVYVNGVPRVIAQSTFDDLMDFGEIKHEQFLSKYNRDEHVVPATRTKRSAFDRTALRAAIRGWKS